MVGSLGHRPRPQGSPACEKSATFLQLTSTQLILKHGQAFCERRPPKRPGA
jgi:hypothetical protein